MTKENIKLPPCNRPGHYYGSIGNLHAFLQSHRQPSCYGHRQTPILIIGKNTSLPLDLVTFDSLFIGNYPHRQLFCRPVIVAPPADLYSTGPWVRVQKRCQQEPDPVEVQVDEEAPTSQHVLRIPPSLSISLLSRRLDLL